MLCEVEPTTSAEPVIRNEGSESCSFGHALHHPPSYSMSGHRLWILASTGFSPSGISKMTRPSIDSPGGSSRPPLSLIRVPISSSVAALAPYYSDKRAGSEGISHAEYIIPLSLSIWPKLMYGVFCGCDQSFRSVKTSMTNLLPGLAVHT